VETGGNPVPTSDTDYKYDPAGNVTRVDTTIQGGQTDTQCFAYDYLRRLTQAWTEAAPCAPTPSTGILAGPAPYWQSYGYDLTGNRTTETRHDVAGGADTTRTYTYPAAGQAQPHTVRSIDTTGPGGPSTAAYGYDVEGNTTARPGGQTLDYDIEGHLASVTQGTATSTYLYDADGARLISHDSTGATLYLPFGVEVHVDPAGVKSSTRYYTFAGLTFAMRTTAGVSFLASDPHGTSTQTVSAANAAVTTRRLDPFGNPRGAQPTWPGNHGFVNGPTDPTGLTHLGAREYDSTLGRFTSVDPILDAADVQSLNGFAYADNSPITNCDPTGLAKCGPDGYKCGMDPNTDQATGQHIGSTAGSTMHSLLNGTGYEDDGSGTIRVTAPSRPTYELPPGHPDPLKLIHKFDDWFPRFRTGHYQDSIPKMLGQVCEGADVGCDNAFLAILGGDAWDIAQGREPQHRTMSKASFGDLALATAAIVGRGGFRGMGKATGPVDSAENAASGVRLRARLAGQQIAGGHAFSEHVVDKGEFPGIRTRGEFDD
jgi:RHS repeat-associated protein